MFGSLNRDLNGLVNKVQVPQHNLLLKANHNSNSVALAKVAELGPEMQQINQTTTQREQLVQRVRDKKILARVTHQTRTRLVATRTTIVEIPRKHQLQTRKLLPPNNPTQSLLAKPKLLLKRKRVVLQPLGPPCRHQIRLMEVILQPLAGRRRPQ